MIKKYTEIKQKQSCKVLRDRKEAKPKAEAAKQSDPVTLCNNGIL